MHHDEVAAASASLLAYVVGYRRARHAEGLEWGEHALASARRVADGGLSEATARHYVGVVCDAMDDRDAAADHHAQAYELRSRLLPPDHPDLANSLNALGNVAFGARNYEEAATRYAEALQLRERVLGPKPSRRGGRPQQRRHCRLAPGATTTPRPRLCVGPSRSTSRRTARPTPDVAQSRNNLGLALRRGGDPAAAEAEHRRALAIREATQGPDHPDVGDPLVGLGRALSDAGRHHEAEPLHERALSLYEAGFGPDHPVVGDALVGLAIARIGLERPAEAAPLLERAAGLPSSAAEEATRLLSQLRSAPVTPQELPDP